MGKVGINGNHRVQNVIILRNEIKSIRGCVDLYEKTLSI